MRPSLALRAAAALLTAAVVAACAPADAAPGAAGAVTGPDAVVPHVAAPGEVDELPTPDPALPVTVASADGASVTVTDVSRILAVDMYGTLAETVFSLGLGDNVVGRDVSTGFDEAADLPLVTVGGHTLSAEAILELDPTVVLTDTTLGPPEVPEQLRAAGIPVVMVEPTRTLDDVGPQIEAVAAALGVPEAGRTLAERTRAEVADAVAAAERTGLAVALGRPPRVAFVYLRGSAVMLLGGPGTGADELVAAVGAQDAGTAVGLSRPFTQLTSEALVTAAPDVLLLFDGGLESVGGLDGLLAVPGVAQTPAGQARRVVTAEDTDLLALGPRTGAVLAALTDALAAALAG